LTTEQLHLLRAALCQPDDALAHWQAWCVARYQQPGQPALTLSLPNLLVSLDTSRQRLLSMVYFSIHAADTSALLKPVVSQTLIHNQHKLEQVQTIADHLAAAGIPALWLTHVPLAVFGYEAIDRRQIDVPDLLVQPAQLNDALRALQSLGFLAPASLRHRHLQSILTLSHPESGTLLLRQHVLRQHPYVEADAGFWAAAQSLRLPGGGAIQTLSPTHLLFHTLVDSYVGRQSVLEWVPDCLMLTRRGLIAWNDLLDLAERFTLRIPVREGVKLLQNHFGLVLPAAVQHRLRCMTPTAAEYHYFNLLGAAPTNALRKEWHYFRRSRLAFRLFRQAGLGASLPQFLWGHLSLRFRWPEALNE
jgi:hypothetical protein